MKSSLKFCVIASGEFDGYVAEPRAYEWDIAAGHAILKLQEEMYLKAMRFFMEERF